MTDLSRFVPLRAETLESITARIDADVNAGIDPDDESFLDTTPGGFYSDLRTAIALELERLWDVATTDTVAASLFEYSWGDYLDAHGATIGVARKDAVAASGTVTFTGTNGTVIPSGVEVSTTQTSPDEEPVEFTTTEGGTVSGGTLTVDAQASEAGAAGNVASAAIDVILSPVSGVTAVTGSAFTGGSDVESDEDYRDRLRIAYSATQGAGSVADYERWALSHPSVGSVRVGPLYDGGGTVRVVITDVNNDPVSATVTSEVQALIDPYSAETLTNGAIAAIGSASTITVDSTTGFSTAGRIYVGDKLVEYTGKTATTFTGCTTSATGSVADNSSVRQHGNGAGLAPIGAMVTVATPSTLSVTVAADVTTADGYSLDGSAGTIDVSAEIEEAIVAYIDSLPPGGENPPGSETPAGSGFVLLKRVEARILSVPGVYSVASTTLNGTGADLAVTASQVPSTVVPPTLS